MLSRAFTTLCGNENRLTIVSQARGLRSAAIPTKIRLTYFQEESFKVELQYKSENEWTDCFETGPLKLPAVNYLGFSAETGELSDNHDIIQVQSHNMHISEGWKGADSGDKGGSGGRKKKNKGKNYDPNRGGQSGGGWIWFFLKVLMVPIVLVGGYVGWTMYRTSKRGSRF